MNALTYDLWINVIDEVIRAHAPLFEAMRRVEKNLIVSKELVDEVKLKGFKEMRKASHPWVF